MKPPSEQPTWVGVLWLAAIIIGICVAVDWVLIETLSHYVERLEDRLNNWEQELLKERFDK